MRHRPLVSAHPVPHTDGSLGCLFVADDQHVGNLLQLGFANFITNLLLAVVDRRPEPCCGQFRLYRLPIVEMAVGDGQHRRLDRRQPHRESPGIVLDQQGDEPLEAAENRPVDDHRPVLGVVHADVLQLEALRHLVIELDGGALPLPADRVGDVEVDLRAVKGAVALVDVIRLPGALERTLERGLGAIPGRDFAQELRRAASTAWRCTPGRSRHSRAAPAAAATPLRTPICSSVTKQCASSCENCRTRVSPLSTPEASLRCSGVCS